MEISRVSAVARGACAALLASLLLAVGCLLPTAARATLNDDDLPGKPLTDGSVDELAAGTDEEDVHRILLHAGEEARITVSGPGGTDYDLYLYGPAADDIGDPYITASLTSTYPEQITYVAAETGWHYLRVRRYFGGGAYTLFCERRLLSLQPPTTPYRLWGRNRYETAVEIAAENFPGWRNVDHVILCCGEDRAAADPLAAAGLTWTYGAPILLTSSSYVPETVLDALSAIRVANGPFELHVVGGPVSVPESRLNDIANRVPGLAYDRIAPYGNRYELAASIARRMREERPNEYWMRAIDTEFVFIANGEDPAKFFDALALSPICAHTGFPILLVGKDHIPAATAQAITDTGATRRIVAGGEMTVSADVLATLGVAPNISTRWSGRTRYDTAKKIMSSAMGAMPPILSPLSTGAVAKLPDALAGGSFLGLRRGCVVLVKTDGVPDVTADFLGGLSPVIKRCYVFGGTNSVTDETVLEIGDALVP